MNHDFNERTFYMQYSVQEAIQILERTPAVLSVLLKDLPDEWLTSNEGTDTFSPYDVVGHLIHGEKTDWRSRAEMILEFGLSKTFVPYDRFAQYEESKGKSLPQLLDEFKSVRAINMQWLSGLSLTATDLDKKGMHPGLGEVTLRQLLSTWVVHDLTHIAQIGRVMAKQYKQEIGPWTEYFRILSF
jgi:hypothetical protein